jgi:hypothetical protein
MFKKIIILLLIINVKKSYSSVIGSKRPANFDTEVISSSTCISIDISESGYSVYEYINGKWVEEDIEARLRKVAEKLTVLTLAKKN